VPICRLPSQSLNKQDFLPALFLGNAYLSTSDNLEVLSSLIAAKESPECLNLGQDDMHLLLSQVRNTMAVFETYQHPTLLKVQLHFWGSELTWDIMPKCKIGHSTPEGYFTALFDIYIL